MWQSKGTLFWLQRLLLHLARRIAAAVWNHAVEFEAFVRSDFRTLRGQICITQGPKVVCVRQVAFG
jgi:hypothetical protein